MPLLKVYCRDQPQRVEAVAKQNNRNFHSGVKYIEEAAMGTYCWSDELTPAFPPLLGTAGASPCVILVVHCQNGKGALGHLGGTYRHNDLIVEGLVKMYGSISHPKPLDTIVIAGGGGIAEEYADRRPGGYRADVLRQVRAYFKGPDVRWPVRDGTDVNESYSAAAYLPTLHELALSETRMVRALSMSVLKSGTY